MLGLGQWVLRQACGQLLAWAGDPVTARIEIAVNVSARQFHHPQFAAQVLEALAEAGIDARRRLSASPERGRPAPPPIAPCRRRRPKNQPKKL